MDEYLWPARHVAEYAYCPRLFYLMEVEGVYYPNADTEKGKAVHKRVDKPSAANNGNGFKTDDAGPQSDLEAELNLKADQCIIIDLGADEQSARDAVAVLGESLPKAQTGVVVV